MKKIKYLIRKFRFLYFKYLLGYSYIGSNTFIGKNCSISRDIKTGCYVFIGKNSVIYPEVIIDDYSMLASGVKIVGGDHKFNLPGVPMIFSGRDKKRRTYIGKDVWVGINSTIKCGIVIGDGSIIAMNSNVIKDVEPFTIVGGNPARYIRNRFDCEKDISTHIKMLETDLNSLGFNESNLTDDL